jgi:hypothetical protein
MADEFLSARPDITGVIKETTLVPVVFDSATSDDISKTTHAKFMRFPSGEFYIKKPSGTWWHYRATDDPTSPLEWTEVANPPV